MLYGVFVFSFPGMFPRARQSLKRRFDEAVAPYKEAASDALSLYQDVKEIVSSDPMPTYKKSKTHRNYRSRRTFVTRSPLVEKKYVTLNTVGTNITNAWQLALVNGIGAGTGVNQRSGRIVCASSILMRGWIRFNTVADHSSARLVLVWDRAPDGTTATGADVFAYAYPSSTMNQYNTGRFKVLWDRQFALGDSNTEEKFSCYKILNPRQYSMRFLTTADTIAGIQSGALYICWISNEVANYPSFDFTLEFKYTDL